MTTQVTYGGQTQIDTDGAAAVFARLRARGLTDCLGRTFTGGPPRAGCTCPEPDTCSHVQTFRLRNRVDSRPTQMDYAFASQPMIARLARSRVVDDDEAWTLSDHCPVIPEFNKPEIGDQNEI
jgi:endonuclease/exonuclease/phosphatase family metal-dependent hydrolase